MGIFHSASRIFFVAAISVLPFIAAAQNYPEKPIQLIVPFPAGGVTDLASRILGKELSSALGEQVVIDNRSGASGAIGAAATARATPDGYTLMMGNISTLAVNSVAFKNLSYDAETSFVPISMVAKQPMVLAINKNSDLRTMSKIAAFSASKPGGLNFGSGGASFELALEAIKQSTGIESTTVRYQGDSKALLGLLGGEIDLVLGSLSTLGPQIQSGAIHAVAITSEDRSPVLPQTPTLKELGVPLEATSWQALVAPAGTPRPIIDKLNVAVQRALERPDVRKQYELQGVAASPSTVEELQRFVSAELAFWRNVAIKSGFKAQ